MANFIKTGLKWFCLFYCAFALIGELSLAQFCIESLFVNNRLDLAIKCRIWLLRSLEFSLCLHNITLSPEAELIGKIKGFSPGFTERQTFCIDQAQLYLLLQSLIL